MHSLKFDEVSIAEASSQFFSALEIKKSETLFNTHRREVNKKKKLNFCCRKYLFA